MQVVKCISHTVSSYGINIQHLGLGKQRYSTKVDLTINSNILVYNMSVIEMRILDQLYTWNYSNINSLKYEVSIFEAISFANCATFFPPSIHLIFYTDFFFSFLEHAINNTRYIKTQSYKIYNSIDVLLHLLISMGKKEIWKIHQTHPLENIAHSIANIPTCT